MLQLLIQLSTKELTANAFNHNVLQIAKCCALHGFNQGGVRQPFGLRAFDSAMVIEATKKKKMEKTRWGRQLGERRDRWLRGVGGRYGGGGIVQRPVFYRST